MNPPATKRSFGANETQRPAPAPQTQRQTGTALIPYDDVERFTFKSLRDCGRRRAPGYVYWPLKLVRTALLLIAFVAFGGGLYDAVSWSAHKLIGQPLQGTVATMEPAAVGLATPVVDYVLPFDGSEWRVESRLPRDDLKVGDKVELSVIPGSEGLTRIERSSFWRGASVAALLGGAGLIWVLLTYWPSVETLLGWRRQRESAASNGLNYAAAASIVLILGLTAWMRFIYMPWLGVSEYGSLLTAPDTAMRKAAVRCGPSGENPLNVCEMRVLELVGGSEGAYLAALRENDFESLVRYHAAIARADIPFRIDWSASAPLLLDREPAILAGLLAAGAVPPPEVAFDLMAVAESRGWTEVLSALKNAPRPGA